MNYHVYTTYHHYPQQIRPGEVVEEEGSTYWIGEEDDEEEEDDRGNCFGSGGGGVGTVVLSPSGVSCEDVAACPTTAAALACAAYSPPPPPPHHTHSSDSAPMPPVFRDYKKRTTCNKKERRRTRSINNAFADLRDRIPNVPADTKLSKIKTLRLATSYICYLMEVLENDDCGDGFKADLPSQPRRSSGGAHFYHNNKELENKRRSKGRTGWPQHVWALELKQETL